MRTHLAISFVLALAAAGCGGSSDGAREYPLKGQILAMGADHLDATIKHDDIPGFMPAMTMSYKVKDAGEYESLAPGDLLTATLVVGTDPERPEIMDVYLKDVTKVGSAPFEAPERSASPMAAPGFELLADGQPVPDFDFTTQDGEKVSLETYRGRAVIVTFTYTSCPMPTFCPLMDKNFAAIQTALKEKHNDLKVHLLSVSIDPAVDTPPVLKAHGESLGLDPEIWSFVTGDRDDIDAWAARFGVSISRAMNDPKDITHNLRTAVIDRQGNLVRTYTGNEWTPSQVLADVRVMVGID
jgi:protein SCO1/2